jgi:hypothetical protein
VKRWRHIVPPSLCEDWVSGFEGEETPNVRFPHP